MTESERMDRREFMGRAAGTAVVAGVGLATLKESGVARAAAVPRPSRVIGANDRIRVALIGSGGMGRSNMRSFMKNDDVEVIGVCDVDSKHLADGAAEVEKKYGRKPAMEKDFRKILEMPEVDAVIIGTPDHWHALPLILACEAGKDAYCEKPISHDIYEGRAMVNAVKKFSRVVQIGTWQRSTQHFVDAIDYVRSGKLGKVSVCRAWKTGLVGVGHKDPEPVPPELDYDFWLGPAPKVAYRSNRAHYNFRWYFDYAAGMAGDWGVHMLDIALLGMNAWHPAQVSAVGGKIVSGPQDDRDTPDTQIAVYKFKDPDFVMQWDLHVGNPGLDGGGDHGTEFIGSDAVLRIDRGGWSVTDKGGNPREKVASPRIVKERGRNGQDAHIVNFLNCMRSRETPRSDIETMHYTTTVCHLANLASRTGKQIEWDGAAERVTNDRSIMNDQSYRREYRRPWKLPFHKV